MPRSDARSALVGRDGHVPRGRGRRPPYYEAVWTGRSRGQRRWLAGEAQDDAGPLCPEPIATSQRFPSTTLLLCSGTGRAENIERGNSRDVRDRHERDRRDWRFCRLDYGPAALCARAAFSEARRYRRRRIPFCRDPHSSMRSGCDRLATFVGAGRLLEEDEAMDPEYAAATLLRAVLASRRSHRELPALPARPARSLCGRAPRACRGRAMYHHMSIEDWKFCRGQYTCGT